MASMAHPTAPLIPERQTHRVRYEPSALGRPHPPQAGKRHGLASYCPERPEHRRRAQIRWRPLRPPGWDGGRPSRAYAWRVDPRRALAVGSGRPQCGYRPNDSNQRHEKLKQQDPWIVYETKVPRRRSDVSLSHWQRLLRWKRYVAAAHIPDSGGRVGSSGS